MRIETDEQLHAIYRAQRAAFDVIKQAGLPQSAIIWVWAFQLLALADICNCAPGALIQKLRDAVSSLRQRLAAEDRLPKRGEA